MYDIDSNGAIELAEMKKMLVIMFKIKNFRHKIGQGETPEEMAERIFQEMDCNSDGKVEFNEFIECCLKDESLIEILSHFKL